MGVETSILLTSLQNLLTFFQKERHYKDDKKDAALEAINTALISTRQYIEESQGQKCHDRLREFEISRLWADAAVKSRHANEELAIRLNDKSAYWSDKLEWSEEERNIRKIDLISIQDEVKALLKN